MRCQFAPDTKPQFFLRGCLVWSDPSCFRKHKNQRLLDHSNATPAVVDEQALEMVQVRDVISHHHLPS
jgi:hypothetical protein